MCPVLASKPQILAKHGIKNGECAGVGAADTSISSGESCSTDVKVEDIRCLLEVEGVAIG